MAWYSWILSLNIYNPFYGVLIGLLWGILGNLWVSALFEWLKTRVPDNINARKKDWGISFAVITIIVTILFIITLYALYKTTQPV
jgi:hypothetical protein